MTADPRGDFVLAVRKAIRASTCTVGCQDCHARADRLIEAFDSAVNSEVNRIITDPATLAARQRLAQATAERIGKGQA